MTRVNRLLTGVLASAVLLAATGCPGPLDSKAGKDSRLTIEITALRINRTGPVYMEIGDTLKLSAVKTPSKANTGIAWASADEDVATVDESGLVTALALGATTVTVRSKEDSSVNASISVQVVTEIAPIEGFVMLNQPRDNDGGISSQNTTAVPSLVDGRMSIVNKHSGTGEATLSSTGLAGYTLMYYGTPLAGNFKFEARVRIYDAAAGTARGVAMGAFGVPAGGRLGDKNTPVALMFQRNGGAEVRSFWTKTGTTPGNGVGNPNIASPIPEYIYSVERNADGYTFTVKNSKTGDLIASNVVDNVEAGAVAGVDPKLRHGENVYVGFAAGGASMEISNIKIWKDDLAGSPVYETAEVSGSPVRTTGVSISGPQLNADADFDYQNSLESISGTIALTAQVLPSEADDKGVTWTSSNSAVVTVEPDSGNPLLAEVSVLGAGSAVVTVTTADGGWTARYRLNITSGEQPVQSITVTGKSEVMVGLKTPLAAHVFPSYATNQVVTWSSGNESVATVDASGMVTAVSEGSAVITAVATDGSGVSGTFTIEVVAATNLIWSWTAGTDSGFTINSSSRSVEINGKTLFQTGGTIVADASGLVLGNGRFLLGSAMATPVTSATVYDPDGELNLTLPTRLTVTYSSKTGTTGLSHLYVNNNTTGAANSVHGSSSVISGSDSGTERVYNINLSANDALATSFIQFRSDSSNTITITSIVLEYVTE